MKQLSILLLSSFILLRTSFAVEQRRSGETENKRHCADPTTVLYAVGGMRYFGEVGPGACDVREDGCTRWNAGWDKQHFHNAQRLPIGELAAVMEELLLRPPKRRGGAANTPGYSTCKTWEELLDKTGARRTLPRPIYDVSRDGAAALTHDFQRMKHGGTAYVGIPDRYAQERAPAECGIEKTDLDTGRVQFLISLKRMAENAFPQGYSDKSNLYFFREGWNPSGTRFIAFLKNSADRVYTGGWSISADGQDVRFFYDAPSHHTWLDDTTILEGRGFTLYPDNGAGKPAQHLASLGNANPDPTILPGGAWILGDTYVTRGCQHLFLFHRPSGLFVPLAKLRSTAPDQGIHRVDLHVRTSRDGRIVSIDATHEGLGRQMYIVPIGHVLDHPPGAAPSEPR
jgi:hypothetical protein